MTIVSPRPIVVFRDPADGRLTMNFSENGGQCPLLQTDFTCGWYGNRPMACVRFPEQPNPGCLVWPA